MRRRVALCNFNPADYSRWEGQEGVGLQGETPLVLVKRMVAAFIRCRTFSHRTDLVVASALTSYSRDSSRADYRAWLVHLSKSHQGHRLQGHRLENGDPIRLGVPRYLLGSRLPRLPSFLAVWIWCCSVDSF